MAEARESTVLGARDVPEALARVERWHRLMNDAFVRLWWSDDKAVTVEFDANAAPDVRTRLLQLTQAERRSCPALHWQVRRAGPHLRLQVRGPGATEAVATLMY